ncbi:MAG: hypothetical protein Kow006_05190 [Gammaproteobacteria bacterium]
MADKSVSKSFLLGNTLLAVALVMLLFMGRLWEWLGALAMVLWIAVVAAGVYFVMSDRQGPGGVP